MNDGILKAVVGIMTAGVISSCGILWNMSNTLTEIKTTVRFMQKDYTDHERRIVALEAEHKK